MPLPVFRYSSRLLASLILACITILAAGQKNFMDGYIIEKNKDSVRGQIDYRDWGVNPDHIAFRQTGGTQSRILGTADLLAFGVNGDRYEAYTIHVSPYSINPEKLTSEEEIGAAYDTTVFLQVATHGKLTLWELREATGRNYYFVSGREKPEQLRVITRLHTTDDGITRFEQWGAYKNQLTYLMQDCEVAVKQVAGTEYGLQPLKKLVFSYNNCGKDTVESRGDGHDRGKVQFFAVAGFKTTTVKFTGDAGMANQHYPASAGPVIGAGAHIILPRNRQQFSFVTDLVWQHFQSESGSSQQNMYLSEVGHIAYSLLKLEILFRYTYPGAKVRPFVEAGMANSVAVGMNAYQSYTDRLDNTSYTGPFLDGSTRNYQQGWLLGGGLTFGRWTVEGRYEASSGISDASEIGSPTNSWYALVSVDL